MKGLAKPGGRRRFLILRPAFLPPSVVGRLRKWGFASGVPRPASEKARPGSVCLLPRSEDVGFQSWGAGPSPVFPLVYF